jgi:hypothetical protein
MNMRKIPYDLPRDDDGQLTAYAWPGGYPMYYVDSENSALCVACARKADADADEFEKFKPCAFDINWEDTSLYCDQCSQRIASAYGDDDDGKAAPGAPGADDDDDGLAEWLALE